jgi:ferredoxin
MIASGECTNCGRCIAICPESSLSFTLRARIVAGRIEPNPGGSR